MATWRGVDTKLGEYQTFGTLVQGYGGWKWKPAIAAAEKHALKCAAMGGKWIKLDSDFSGLTHFLKMSMTHKYISDNAWNQYLRYDNNGEKMKLDHDDDEGNGKKEGKDTAAAAPPSEKPDEPVPPPPKPVPDAAKAKGKAKSKGKARPVKKEVDEDKAKEEKFLQQELSKASKHRGEYRNVVAKAEQLIRQIKTDATYSDINNEANLGRLEQLHCELLGSLIAFCNRFLVEEWKTIKQSSLSDKLIVDLRSFSDLNLGPLADFTAKVLRRHAA